MSLIFTSLIYLVLFIILTIKELITDKYDHDIDQFMYFGSRLLHGELIWTTEFDDKSPIVQYIFSLPAALKNTSVFVLITLIVSIIAALMGYLMLKDILQNSSLELNKKTNKKIICFGTILYLTLLVSIHGSLHHINAISSSLCLITIAITYLNRNHNNKILLNISAITSAISISIRPYYLLNIIVLPIWINIREGISTSEKKSSVEIEKLYRYIKDQTNWILMLIFYIILFNITPYLWTGHLSDFLSGIKLNSIDYVNHNIFERQYINIGKNPILYPVLVGMIILPLIRIGLSKIISKYHKRIENGPTKLLKLDIDIIFFCILSPILLEIMFYRKHFFGHYFTLFCPFILISIVLLLAILARLDKLIYDFHIIKIIFKNISFFILIVCLVTNQSIPNAINEITNRKSSSKSYKLILIKEFVNQEKKKGDSIRFLAPESNYIHWKLDESRHGFPQKAVFRNIAQGKMDKLINKYNKLNYRFLLPTSQDLCETLNKEGPEYIISENNSYSLSCLKEKSSKYKLISKNQKLKENNIHIFKKFK